MKTFICCIYLLTLVFSSATRSADLVELQLIERLDEARGFCIDIRGHKKRAKIRKGLQAHSCYSYQGEIAVDQAFDKDLLNQESFFLPAFNVCMEVEGYFENAKLLLRRCSGQDFQRFKLTQTGQIKLVSGDNLCVAIGRTKSREGGGGSPPHLIRPINLQDCSKIDTKHTTWMTYSLE